MAATQESDPSAALRKFPIYWEHFDDVENVNFKQDESKGFMVRQVTHPNSRDWHFRVLTPFLRGRWWGVFPRGYTADHYPLRPPPAKNMQKEGKDTEYSGILEGVAVASHLVDPETGLDRNFVQFTNWLNRLCRRWRDQAMDAKSTKAELLAPVRKSVLERIKTQAESLKAFKNPQEAPPLFHQCARFQVLYASPKRSEKEETEFLELSKELGFDEEGMIKDFLENGARNLVAMMPNKEKTSMEPLSHHIRLGGKVFKRRSKEAKEAAEKRGLRYPDGHVEAMANAYSEKDKIFYGYAFNEVTMTLVQGPNGERNLPVPYDFRKDQLTDKSVAAWEVIISPSVGKNGQVTLKLEPRHCHLLHSEPKSNVSQHVELEMVPGATPISAPWLASHSEPAGYGKAEKARSPPRYEPYAEPKEAADAPPKANWDLSEPPVISPSDEFE